MKSSVDLKIRVLIVVTGICLSIPGSPASAAKAPKAAKTIPLRAVAITTGQGQVSVSACPVTKGKGICAKGAKAPGGVARISSDQGDLNVAVPVGVVVSVSTTQGDVTISGVPNVLSISTDQGKVTATGLRSETVTVETNQGDVSLAFVRDARTVDVKTNQGKIDVSAQTSGIEGTITAKTMEGNITLRPTAPVIGIDARTQQGDIDITLVGSPYKVDAKSTQGTVTNTVATGETSRLVTAIAEKQGDVTIKPSA